jgi:hypothetical protein
MRTRPTERRDTIGPASLLVSCSSPSPFPAVTDTDDTRHNVKRERHRTARRAGPRARPWARPTQQTNRDRRRRCPRVRRGMNLMLISCSNATMRRKHVARRFRSTTIALSSRMPPYCRHGCKRETTWQSLVAFQRAARCPARCRTRHSVRGEPHRVRSRVLSVGGACTARARRTSTEAAPPLMGGRHASCGWSEGGSQLRDAAGAAALERFLDVPPRTQGGCL